MKSNPRRINIEPMDLSGILERIEIRLQRLDLSDNGAQIAAKRPGAISNLRAAVKRGGRRGISTATLIDLSRVLQTTPEWLLRGEGDEKLEAMPSRLDADVASLTFEVILENLRPDLTPDGRQGVAAVFLDLARTDLDDGSEESRAQQLRDRLRQIFADRLLKK